MNALMRSLSARLLGIFLLTALVYAVASRYAVDLVLDRDYLREVIGAHMTRYTSYILDDLEYPPRIDRAETLVAGNPFDIRIDGPSVSWSSNPQFPDPDIIDFQSSEFLDDLRTSGGDAPWVSQLRLVGFARHEGRSYGLMQEGDYRIVMVTPRISDAAPSDLTWPLIGLVSVLVLAGCYVAVRWAVAPVKLIKAGADRIGQGDLGYRIPVVRNDELGELTTEINSMAGDVQEMLEAKRQLLLAISHELRSPLTRTKVALEFLEDEDSRRNILEDVEEMERLIHELLEGEQLNTRHSALQRAFVDVGELLSELLEVEFADARERIVFNLPEKSVLAYVDPARIRLLVRNLTNNALCHTPEGGPPIELTVSVSGDDLEIRVADQGAGMSPTEVAHATEPFYRADPARARHTGGFGLGLYLCQRIAEAHGGSLRIDSQPGAGTRVTVRLPAAEPEAVS